MPITKTSGHAKINTRTQRGFDHAKNKQTMHQDSRPRRQNHGICKTFKQAFPMSRVYDPTNPCSPSLAEQHGESARQVMQEQRQAKGAARRDTTKVIVKAGVAKGKVAQQLKKCHGSQDKTRGSCLSRTLWVKLCPSTRCVLPLPRSAKKNKKRASISDANLRPSHNSKTHPAKRM